MQSDEREAQIRERLDYWHKESRGGKYIFPVPDDTVRRAYLEDAAFLLTIIDRLRGDQKA